MHLWVKNAAADKPRGRVEKVHSAGRLSHLTWNEELEGETVFALCQGACGTIEKTQRLVSTVTGCMSPISHKIGNRVPNINNFSNATEHTHLL